MADYDCQMYYPITEVQEITAYNFVPTDQVQDAVIKDGVRDMVDPDHIISTEDFTSTTFKLADGLTPADAGKTASWKVIITSTTHGDTTGTITVKITAKDAPVVPKPEPKPEPSQPGGSTGGNNGGSSSGGGSSSSSSGGFVLRWWR